MQLCKAYLTVVKFKTILTPVEVLNILANDSYHFANYGRMVNR